jgi:aryl-alcohol dehydrogenase-like predicted oxidoreductase
MSLCQSPHPLAMLDAVWCLGCNTLDVAHVYGHAVEATVGKWLHSRIHTHAGRMLRGGGRGGQLTRSDVVLVGKAGHPFRNSAHAARLSLVELDKDLTQSLDRLRTSYLDVLLLHRDDPHRFPDVGPVVSAMHTFVSQRRIRRWGLSNWSLPRMQLAVEYAVAHNLCPPTLASPQFSLAVPSRPVWPGGTHLTPPNAAVARVTGMGMALFTWAPLAEGFLCGSAGRAGNSDCWRTPLNVGRRDRLQEMARRKGVTAAELCVAFVLHSGVATAVVGTTSVSHFQDAVRGSSIHLEDTDIAYLTGHTV